MVTARFVVKGAPDEAAKNTSPEATPVDKSNKFSKRITTKGTRITTARNPRNSNFGLRHRDSISDQERLTPMVNIRVKMVIVTKFSNNCWSINLNYRVRKVNRS